MLDQSRPGSTMAMHPIDSIQDEHDKWATRAADTIKLPTQSTTIRTWNFYTVYAFRQTVDEHDNVRTTNNPCQKAQKLQEVVCFFPTSHPPPNNWRSWGTNDLYSFANKKDYHHNYQCERINVKALQLKSPCIFATNVIATEN